MKKQFDPSAPYDSLPPLPPPREASETLSVLKKEAAARQALGELKGIANIIPNQAILINAIVLREAKDSSEIENIITTRDRLYRALASSGGSVVDAATKEVVLYREALRFGERLISDRGLVSVNDICRIHSIIVGNDAGIRKTPGTALVNDSTGETIYTPPQDPRILTRLMANFTDYLNKRAASLADMAVLHYQFESIHPFHDGNGRTGRILNILFLILKGFLEIPILYLSSEIIERKDEYYRLLNAVTVSEQWERWILFMLEATERTARRTIDQVKLVKNSLDETIDRVRANARKIYSKELVESLFVHPYCKVGFLIDSLGVERKAASRYLRQLEDLGIVKGYKIGRENLFVNIALMEILARA
jgi:Fic family protein